MEGRWAGTDVCDARYIDQAGGLLITRKGVFRAGNGEARHRPGAGFVGERGVWEGSFSRRPAVT
jgi:hypothetical protein